MIFRQAKSSISREDLKELLREKLINNESKYLQNLNICWKIILYFHES